ncbi:hypothetical protein HOL21_00455 [Candidatus Woesearchaeota archaeon]|jgi:hypothetical protein|nr:hypothetical protein [Candidatus Woesearchaeota archaeon]MBT5396668.1 hypothetical protein [Candidatus Woesearchaeota archaeon]MBT6367545.1 hypothetical protein [Candidatus Woesearchaeota archaeon]MBT7763044.1 hypothetical protein [Candidatus Woesearchaeota archaeon]
MERKHKYIITAIFCITLITRLVLAFTVPNFTYDSYFHIEQVNHITENGFPQYNDPLSYGGRQLFFLPLFHYTAALFSTVLPIELVAKILPNIFLASLTILVYVISRKISKNETASLFAASIAGLLPIIFTTNTFSPETLFLPLMFVAIYSFLNIDKKNSLYIYMISFLLLSILHPATFLLITGFGIYSLLSFVEGKKIRRAETELILSSIFFYIWVQFLFFKNVLLKEGISFVWQNIPPQIILEYFPLLSIPEAVILVSAIPFLAGIFVVYTSLFKTKNKKTFFLISLVISTTLLSWLRLIPSRLSLSFLGVTLAILFALFYKDIIEYLTRTKFPSLKRVFLVFVVILIGITMIFPAVTTALNQETPMHTDIEAFIWIERNTESNGGILALIEEGHIVSYYSKRRNMMDTNFALVNEIEEKFKDLSSVFTSSFETHVLDILDKNNIQYIILTSRAQQKYEMEEFRFLSDDCFELVYNKNAKVYKKLCTVTIE